MGTAMRRTSSILTITRPATSSSSDSGSVKGVERSSSPTPSTTATPPPPPPGVPSPIAESPAREAAANAEETEPKPVVGSPLAQEVVSSATPVAMPEAAAADDAPTPAVVPAETAAETAQPTEEPNSEAQPTGQIFESAAGPGAFTDEPESIRTTEEPRIAESTTTQVIEESSPPPPAIVESKKAEDTTLSQESKVDQPAAPEGPVAPPGLNGQANYFDTTSPPTAVVEPTTAVVPETFKEVVIENTTVESPPPPSHLNPVHDTEVAPPVITMPEIVEQAPTPIAATTPAATYDLDIEGNELWGSNFGKPNPSDKIRMPVPEDPFADPVSSPSPKITVTRELAAEEVDPIVMPTPPVHNVRPSRSIQSIRSVVPSTRSGHFEVHADETRPLLQSSRPVTPQPYLGGSTSRHHLNVSSASARGASFALSSPVWQSITHPVDTRRLHELGWLEYVLPDATLYYVHPTLRVTTDIDLRVPKNLDAVTSYLDRQKDSGERSTGPGMELWLREEVTKKGPKRRGDWFNPVKAWVDHRKRSVILDTVWEGSSHGPRRGKKIEEDALDTEYRYWSFMEAHPAHVALPHNSRSEAMDILTWAWTDRLLPATRSTVAPFSQDECQELMSLLRSFGDHQGDSGIQPVLHTRIVARILLRAAQWRQLHFRPDKPLPQDAVQPMGRPPQRPPFRRALLDFVVSCFCLGVPYLFFNRTQQHRMDEESGLRSAGPMLMVGACTCLMAAIVLSASVTFLSLPGLDNLSRLIGFVAILFASFSMASTLVAIFKWKADMERAASILGGEGLMMLSRRSVILSLPVVFLAYSIIAFVTGIVLYSFYGVTLHNKDLIVRHFEDYTRWTVLGVVGALGGILFTSFLILKR